MKHRKCIGFAVIWLMIAGTGQPGAQDAREQNTIHFSSEQLEIDNDSKTARLSGNVKVSQGTTVITSQQLQLHFGNAANPEAEKTGDETDMTETGGTPGLESLPGGGQVREIVAAGDVRIQFDQALAEADEAIYDVHKRILTLTGKSAKVISNKNVISGSKIIVDRNSGLTKVVGSVEGVYYPEEGGGIE